MLFGNYPLVRDEARMLTLRQASADLGVAVQTLQTQIRKGKLAATRVDTPRGPVWKVMPEEIERYRDESRSKPGRKPGKE